MHKAVPVVAFMAFASVVHAQTPAPPLGGAALEAWLKAGHYKQWRSESQPHDSQGPHFGRVRAYLNPAAFESMQSGAKNHPKGTVTVKELYGQGVLLCRACHLTGRDYVLTPWPLR